MLYLDDLKPLKLYRKKFFLPINLEDKKHGSAVLLLSPDATASHWLMSNNPFTINRNNSFFSYYIERDIMYTINHESRRLEVAHNDYTTLINEQPSVFIETTDIRSDEHLDDCDINEYYCHLGDKLIFFNELYDESILEASALGQKYKTMLYNDRIRNNKEVFRLYEKAKADNPFIKKTFVSLSRYNAFNLFVDLYYYNEAYLHNNTFSLVRSTDMYFEFIKRFINDKRITNAGYNKRTVFIPIEGWALQDPRVFNYMKNLNPISVIFKKLKTNYKALEVFSGIDFVFFSDTGYFKMTPDALEERDYAKFMMLMTRLGSREPIDDSDEPDNSPNGIATAILDKLEVNKGIVVDRIKPVAMISKPMADTVAKLDPKTMVEKPVVKPPVPTDVKRKDMTSDQAKKVDKAVAKAELKAQLVDKILVASQNAKDEEDALNKMEEDKQIKQIINDLQNDPDDDRVKLSAARSSRIVQAQDDFMKKQIEGKTVKDLVNESNKPKELPETSIPISTINDEWHHMKSINFEKEYDLNADIIKCLNSLSDMKTKTYPVSILDVTTEDTSTPQDSLITYTVACETFAGARFHLKFDVPKLRENRFMRLGGNEKIFSIEMPLIPISKVSATQAQISTLYHAKITIEPNYTSSGKSNQFADRLMKALKKYKGHDIKITNGDNKRICNKYDLPIDYVDLASVYSKIVISPKSGKQTDTLTIYFNQDDIRALKGVTPSKGLPISVTDGGTVLYYTKDDTCTVSEKIASIIKAENPKFGDLYDSQSDPRKSTYSRAKILNTYIPVIVVLAHDLGLTKAIDLAGIKYEISEKKSQEVDWDSVRLEDGFINYKATYTSTMLMNGLKDCGLEEYSIKDINSKMTWVNILDNFGGRIKTDGLDNFANCMYDPITVEICKDYNLPTTYHEALIYASNLLVDNKYTLHKDLATNRYRTNEAIAAQVYDCLASSYREYMNNIKRGHKTAKMTMKQSAVIDAIMAKNTTSDLSIFQPLYEIETKNTISTKGYGGMNSDHSYQLDKRGYDDSMVNIIAQATGFASTVGVNRQTTLNPNIEGGRGYFKQSSLDDVNVTNTLSMTEALSPYTVSSDDPFRNDMTFVQTAKHSTPIEYGTPLLVTTGADAAMPYLTSDMFCHKAKKAGVVKELVPDQYMLVEYNNGGGTEFVDLSEQTKKNSDGGFYITLQLKTDLKVGQKVKAGQILAYDSKSFSNRVGGGKGNDRQVAYNVGCLTKIAVMTTEDGFEDSGICSTDLSEQMSSDIVVMKEQGLLPMTNVLFLAKKGQTIREGEPVLIYQNAFDEKDANLLMKNLNIDDGDITEIGRNVIKSKVTGIISDIKIYRTCELDELSDSLRKIVTSYESKVNKIKNIAAKASNPVVFPASGKLEQTGKVKKLYGVLIEIYMKYHDKLAIGDKVSSNANKNIIYDVYSSDDAPYTDFRPNEKIDLVNSCSAIDGRMITSPFMTGLLNKAMIELSRKVDDIMGIKWKTLHEIYHEDMNNQQ